MKTDFELSIFIKKVKQIYEYNDKKTGNNPRN